MSEARTVWHDLTDRQGKSGYQRFTNCTLAATILITMTVAEVQFLCFVAGPDSVNLISAADGIIPPTE